MSAAPSFRQKPLLNDFERAHTPGNAQIAGAIGVKASQKAVIVFNNPEFKSLIDSLVVADGTANTLIDLPRNAAFFIHQKTKKLCVTSGLRHPTAYEVKAVLNKDDSGLEVDSFSFKLLQPQQTKDLIRKLIPTITPAPAVTAGFQAVTLPETIPTIIPETAPVTTTALPTPKQPHAFIAHLDKALADRDVTALAKYFIKGHSFLLRTLFKFHLDDEQNKDILQDVQAKFAEYFLEDMDALKATDSDKAKTIETFFLEIGSGKDFHNYICRSLANNAISILRSHKLRPALALDTIGDPESEAAFAHTIHQSQLQNQVNTPSYPLWAADPAQIAERKSDIKEAAERLRESMNSTGGPSVRVMVDYFDAVIAGTVNSKEEFAAQRGVTPGTIKTHGSRARAAIERHGLPRELLL